MLYVYAITDSSASPTRAGIGGAALSAIGEEGVFALVSEHEAQRVGVDEESLWSHESVVEELLERGAVLPMRFGSTVENREELTTLLRRRRSEFKRSLDRVRGAVEVAVRGIASPPGTAKTARVADVAAGPGTAYMLSRLGEERRAEAMAAQIHEPLASLSRASRSSEHKVGAGLINAAYLVDRDRIELFRERVEELDRGLSEATVISTGPWPPYSFTSEEAGR